MIEELVSIIVPVYNAQVTIKKTIQSVLSQTYSNFELIIIDDGSTDKSLSICNSIKNEKIVILSQSNSGPAVARNYGLKTAKGKYVCFLDSDDTIVVDYLQTLISKVGNNEMLICGYNIVKDGYVEKKYAENSIVKASECMIKVLEDNVIGGYLWNKLFLRSIIEENKIDFNENIFLGEDLLFVEKYLSYCNSIRIIDKRLYNYIFDENSISHKLSNKNVTLLTSFYEIWRLSEDKNFKSVVINRFISQALTYYELLTDKSTIKRIINSFINDYSITDSYIKQVVSKSCQMKYRLYKKNKRLYLFTMKLFRIIKNMSNR